MNERFENALFILESEIARRFGLEHPVTIQTFMFTEEVRSAFCGYDTVEEKTSWTLEELAELPEEERMRVLTNLPDEEGDKLVREIFEKDPVGLLISILEISLMNEQ